MVILSNFSTIIETSIISSIIGIVILILRKILNGKVNSKWIYLMWFILLFKLVVPIRIESTLSLFNYTPKEVIQEGYISNIQNEYDSLKLKYDEYIEEQMKNEESIELEDVISISEELKQAKTKNDIVSYIIPIIWVSGVSIFLIWFIISNILLSYRIRKCGNCGKLESILEKCKEKVDIKRNIKVVVNDVVSTPALFGIFRVKILIPSSMLNLSDENIEYILIHELTHYKRKDIIMNYLLIIIQAIHWFNPIIWICFRFIRQDLELATDESVLNEIGENNYKSYANALIEVLNVYVDNKFAPRLIGMVDSKSNIKRRIKMIKSLEIFKKKRVIIALICIILIVILSVFLLTSKVTFEYPIDKFYISNLDFNSECSRGCYEWKYNSNEKVADCIEPLEFAKELEKLNFSVSSVIKIYNETGKYDNLEKIDIYNLEDNLIVKTVNDFENLKYIEFELPDIVGEYYYLIKVYHKNGSYVDYSFAVNLNNGELAQENTSKVVATLKKYIELEEYNLDEQIVSQVTESELEKINKIISKSTLFMGVIDFAKGPDYSIILDNGEKFDFIISNNIIYINTNSHQTYFLYDGNDYKYIINFFKQKDKFKLNSKININFNLIERLNLDSLKFPPDLYLVSTVGQSKFGIGGYSWKTSNNSELSSIINGTGKTPSEIVKDEEEFGFIGVTWMFVSLKRNDDFGINKTLPESTKIKYRFYKEDEDISTVLFKEAVRMVDGSYYITEIPFTRKEYILELLVEYDDINKCSYYKKVII